MLPQRSDPHAGNVRVPALVRRDEKTRGATPLKRLMVHIPVNMRGYLSDRLGEALGKFRAETGEDVLLCTPHDPEYTGDCTEEWLLPAVRKGILPDLTVVNATELAPLDKTVKEAVLGRDAPLFVEKHPVRKEMQALLDPEGYFYPISVTPLVMIYNPGKMAAEKLTHSWKDLFNPDFRVVFPDRDKPLTRAAGAYLLSVWPDEFAAFERRVVYDGTPASVVRSVMSGEYDVAMTNAGFASVGTGDRLAVNAAKEGAVLLPQLLVWRKNTGAALLPFAEFMAGRAMQSYFSGQGSWPVHAEVTAPCDLSREKQLREWRGWTAYFNSVLAFDNYRA